MDALQAYLPQAEGLLPKWLLLVRPATRLKTPHMLTKTPGLDNILRQQHPILHNPALHLARLQPDVHGPAPENTRARNRALEPYIRDLDVPYRHGALLRRVQHQRSRVLSIGHVELCGGLGTLYERVVCVWDDEVGEAVGRAADCCEYEFGVDVLAVGVVCQGIGHRK
jgi:hypothetical protein